MTDANTDKPTSPQFDKWHGIDRNGIDWHPVIDESKCIGCGMCATTCGRGVYKFDYTKRKSVVANPNHCLVGCQTCANLCPVGAISFVKDPQTTREKAQEIVKKTGVFTNVKQELESKKGQLAVDASEKTITNI